MNHPRKLSPKSCTQGPASSTINQGHPRCLPSAAQLYEADFLPFEPPPNITSAPREA